PTAAAAAPAIAPLHRADRGRCAAAPPLRRGALRLPGGALRLAFGRVPWLQSSVRRRHAAWPARAAARDRARRNSTATGPPVGWGTTNRMRATRAWWDRR